MACRPCSRFMSVECNAWHWTNYLSQVRDCCIRQKIKVKYRLKPRSHQNATQRKTTHGAGVKLRSHRIRYRVAPCGVLRCVASRRVASHCVGLRCERDFIPACSVLCWPSSDCPWIKLDLHLLYLSQVTTMNFIPVPLLRCNDRSTCIRSILLIEGRYTLPVFTGHVDLNTAREHGQCVPSNTSTCTSEVAVSLPKLNR